MRSHFLDRCWAGGIDGYRNLEAASPHLEFAVAEERLQQGEGSLGRRVERLGQPIQIGELDVSRLVRVCSRIAAPLSGQEADRKAMGQIAVRIPDGVELRLRQAAEWDEVCRGNLNSGLLGKLGHGGLSEAAADLSCSRGQAPGAGIPTSGEKYLTILPLEGHHRAGHQHQLGADLLTETPEI